MRIPRRPKWDEKTTPELLVQLENQSFLHWRKDLSKIEETHYDLHITPYERNPEVWRQLWRVIEKSDVVIQIVDGRDPLFFRCLDLEQYVKEVDPIKENILLINKADLLNDAVRYKYHIYITLLLIYLGNIGMNISLPTKSIISSSPPKQNKRKSIRKKL